MLFGIEFFLLRPCNLRLGLSMGIPVNFESRCGAKVHYKNVTCNISCRLIWTQFKKKKRKKFIAFIAKING